MAAVNLVRDDKNAELYAKLRLLEENISRAVWGKPEAVRLTITALLARGHLLIEDVPGVGKTTLARALSRSVGCTFRRIQFTSDLLPSDVLGITIFKQETQKFELRKGPIFANIVLADEVNRTTPRTQSCLLEAMNEGRVSLDGETYTLSAPFMVVSTQNPYEFQGTYPLPESQLDRFLLRIKLGYPPEAAERSLLLGKIEDRAEQLEPVLSGADVVALQNMVDRVRVDPAIADYVLRLVQETREPRRGSTFELGVSTRGAIALVQSAKAYALLEGRDYCIPDDIKRLAVAAFAHRVIVSSNGDQNREDGERAVKEILDRIPVPL